MNLRHTVSDALGLVSLIFLGWFAMHALPVLFGPQHVNAAAAGAVRLVDPWEPETAALPPNGGL